VAIALVIHDRHRRLLSAHVELDPALVTRPSEHFG
jgi:hypothetical protein